MSDAPFDPSKHMTKLRGGAEYLPVAARLEWLRTQHPDAQIDMDHIRIDEGIAIFKATVSLPSGGRATGYGSETPSDFPDFIEKASTKALGRALAALGFGTQFVGDEGVRIADAPVDFRQLANANAPAPSPTNGGGITDKQMKFIQAIGREAGMDQTMVAQDVYETYGCEVAALGRREASEYIERLQSIVASLGANPTQAGTAQSEIPGVGNVEADWMSLITDVKTPKQLTDLHKELSEANVGRPVWDAYGRKATAINSTR